MLRAALVLVCSAGGAVAAAPACKPAGAPVFAIAKRAPPKVHAATATARLYANGAWTTVVTDREGRPAHVGTGCLTPAERDRLHAELTSAPWRVVHHAQAITCRSDARVTQYTWQGKVVHTARDCSGDALDPDSGDTVQLIERLLHVPADLDGALFRCADNPLAPGCP
jgi:hypothetical protein